jgi:hypothetical protein
MIMDPRLPRLVLFALLVLAAPLAGCLSDNMDPPPDDGDDEDPPETSDPPPETSLEWTTRPSVPTARTEVATAILDDELYVIGGFEENDQPSAAVEIFDLQEETWREGPQLPTPLHHASAVAVNGSLHVLGGYNAVPFQATPTHLVLEPGSGTWEQAEPLPMARGAHGAGLLDGAIYLVGGVGPDGELLASVDVYHPGNDSFTSAPGLPTPREHLGAASDYGVHALGGLEGGLDTNVDVHEALVPSEGWVEADPVPTARGGVDAALYNGSIVVAGGEAPESTFAEVEAWDTSQGGWTSLPEMPTPRHGLGVDGWQDQLITAAGGPEPGFTTSDAFETLRLERLG